MLVKHNRAYVVGRHVGLTKPVFKHIAQACVAHEIYIGAVGQVPDLHQYHST